MEKLVLENEYEIVVPLFGAAYMLHQIKAQKINTDLGLLSTVLSPTENSRIQGLSRLLSDFSSTFRGKFNFQGLFKKVL